MIFFPGLGRLQFHSFIFYFVLPLPFLKILMATAWISIHDLCTLKINFIQTKCQVLYSGSKVTCHCKNLVNLSLVLCSQDMAANKTLKILQREYTAQCIHQYVAQYINITA